MKRKTKKLEYVLLYSSDVVASSFAEGGHLKHNFWASTVAMAKEIVRKFLEDTPRHPIKLLQGERTVKVY